MSKNKVNKGVILMGGSGSRLYPLNEVCNKHLINVGGKPMAQWNVELLVESGVDDILIITGKEHMGSIVSYFGGGEEFGCKFTYKVQTEAGGIAQALKLVDGFVHKDEFFFTLLGDNIFEDNIITHEINSNTNIMLVTKDVEDPERYGVMNADLTHIVEKPTNPETNLAVVGLYGYKFTETFKNILFGLEKSDRSEIEVTDLNNYILDKSSSNQIVITKLNGYWTDAGTHESLKVANEYKYRI